METRLYFLAGDVTANALIGGLVGALCAWLIDPGWNMWVAHGTGMLIGMLLSLPLAFPFVICFGAMEVMVSTHLAGMCAGMWVGMEAAHASVAPATGFVQGAAVGLAALACCYLADLWLRRKGDPRGPRHPA